MASQRMLGWWYLCIGAGFIALGARALLAGFEAWTVVLRFLIAFGFLTLGALTLGRQPN